MIAGFYNQDKAHDASLDELLKLKQYSLEDEGKNRILVKIIKEQLVNAQNNEHIRRFFEREEIEIDNINSV
jgi:hypothetical protein